MKHSFPLCLALLLCLTPTTAHAQQAALPFAPVPLTDQAYDDLQTIQDAGVPLPHYPGGTIGSRVPMSGYNFAVGIGLLWRMLTPQAPTASGDAAAARHEAETRLLSHPPALAALTRLVSEFLPELKAQGQDVPAMQAHLGALRPNLPPLPVSPPFTDVPKDHWAFQAVETLRKLGIVRGEADGKFHG